MNIGFALCGSFCTYEKIFPIMEELAKKHRVIPIFSFASQSVDSRFGNAATHIARAEEICGQKALKSIPDVEPIGPQKMLDVLLLAPCTGNTLAKLAHSIADTPVTMAAKSHLRNGKPVVLGVSTNDGLAGAAENIGKLLGKKHYYFIPFGQDDPRNKPTSLVADFSFTEEAILAAMEGRQLQPLLL